MIFEKKRWLMILAVVMTAMTWAQGEWTNLDDEHKVGKRKISSGYLLGKVTLVCKDKQLATQMESIWESFKSKPFVLVGAFDELPPEVTYPVYREAKWYQAPMTTDPIYVVDSIGRIRYKGKDVRIATEVVVQSLTDEESPKNLKEWRNYLDYELEHTPARAYLRLKAFAKAFPKEAKEYAERAKKLVAMARIKDVVKVVDDAHKLKDPKIFGKKDSAKRAKYEKAVREAANSTKYDALKKAVTDANLLQELKNAIADIKWTAVEL